MNNKIILIGSDIKFTDWSLSDYPVKGMVTDIIMKGGRKYITAITQKGMRYTVEERNVLV